MATSSILPVFRAPAQRVYGTLAPLMPSWLTPATAGLLSNKRGANTGADALGLSAQYFNPRAASDQASAIRVIATRTYSLAGLDDTVYWDSGWTGNAGTQPLPVALTGGGSAVYNGRVYYVGGSTATTGGGAASAVATVYSAPLNGSIGGWRTETPLPVATTGGGVCVMTSVGPYLICVGGMTPNQNPTAAVWYAPIGADGVVGSWASAPNLPQARSYVSAVDVTQGQLLVMGGATANSSGNPSTPAAQCYLNQFQASGWVSWLNYGTLATAVYGGFGYFDYNLGLVLLTGGINSTPAAVATTQLAGISPNVANSTQSIGTFATTGASMTTAVAGAAGGYIPAAAQGATGTLYMVGGCTGTTLPGTGTGAVQYTTVSLASGPAAWSTAGGSVGGGSCGGGLATEAMDASGTVKSYRVFAVGATTAGPTVISTCYVGTATGVPSAFASGAASAMGAGSLGTGGAIVANGDGSQTFSFNHGAFSANGFSLGGFGDWDQVQYSVQFTDAVYGNASPLAYTLVKIGQPPTIGSVSPANASAPISGTPALSWAYVPGTGGGQQLNWRAQVKNGATVIYDSGTVPGAANAVAAVLSAPALANGTSYTLVLTVNSQDQAMTGSSVQGTSSTTFTPSLTAPSAPTGLTVTPNHALGNFTVAWTAGTSSTASRVYYRVHGTTPWILVADSVGSGTGAQSYTAMDQLAAATSYDFAVSAINANFAESAMTTATTGYTIDPVQGGWSVFLHVAGQGVTYYAPLLNQGAPKITLRVDAQAIEVQNSRAPIERYGVAAYHSIQLKLFVQNATVLQQLQQLLQQAEQQGATLYYRDGFGAQMTVGLAGNPGDLTYMPPTYRDVSLSLVEIPNLYAVSTANGSAQGYPSQVLGSVAPQQLVELAL